VENTQKKQKTRRIVLIVVLVLIAALAVGGFAAVKGYLNRIGRVDRDPVETIAPEDESFEVDPTPAPTPTPSAAPDEPVVEPPPEPSDDPNVLDIDPDQVEWSFIERIEDDHLINILLVGQDKYPGSEGWAVRQNSDSMILCSINPKTGQTALISFLRDTYVQIPGGYSDNRLNAAYPFGGFPLLDETLTVNFGVSIDANFEVDMTSFETLIDMVGGVEVELTAREAEYMKSDLGMDVTEGVNQLDGKDARKYSQIRAIGNDFARTGRQRTVLVAAFQKVKTLPVNDLLALLYDMLPYLTTDLTDSEILSLAYRLIPMVGSLSVDTHMVPDHDCYTAARIRGMSVLVPDREKIRDRLEQEYLPFQP